MASPFANPLLEDTGVTDMPRPYAPWTPTADMGLGGLGPSAADLAVTGEQLAKQSQFTMPKMRTPASIAFSPSQNKLFVQGNEFFADDAATALRTEELLNQDGTGLPQGGDWVPLDQQAYGQYLQSIKTPSLGRLAKKNFGIGADNLQMLGGYGMQFLGAKQTGQGIVAQQLEDLRRTEPFQRQFTDVGSAPDRGLTDWFVANLAQQGPNLIESAITATVGAFAGALAGGGANPFTAFGGAITAFGTKTAVKQAILAAAKKHAAGEILSEAESKLLREVAGAQLAKTIVTHGPNTMVPNAMLHDLGASAATALGKTQAKAGGAALGLAASNYGMGVADVYGESIESGDPNRALAAAYGVPYALLETMPELVMGLRVLGGSKGKGILANRAFSDYKSLAGKGGELLKRGTVGLGIGGTLEGATEAGQEGLLLGANAHVDWDSPEGLNRLLNSFAAGFGVGGPLGGAANIITPGEKRPLIDLSGGDATNILDSGNVTNPTAPSSPSGTSLVAPITPVTPMGGVTAQQQQQTAVPLLNAPVQNVQAESKPDYVTSSEGVTRQAMPEDVVANVIGNIPPGSSVGSQGVLDIFNGQGVTAGELAARMQPTAVPAQLGYTPEQVVNPAQGALQFSGVPPVAPFNTQMPNQLQIIQERMRRQQEFEAAQQARDTAQQIEIDKLSQDSRYARDLYTMQQAQKAEQQAPTMPMVPIQPRTPSQLSLFKRGQAPKPSSRERARRGVNPLLRAIEAQQEVKTDGRQVKQLALFTQTGIPTIAALKAVGKKETIVPKAATGGSQIKPTGSKANAVTVAKAKAKLDVAKVALKKGEQNAVQKSSATSVDVQKQTKDGGRMGQGDAKLRSVTGKTASTETERKTTEQKSAVQVLKKGPLSLKKDEGGTPKIIAQKGAVSEIPKIGLGSLVEQIINPEVVAEEVLPMGADTTKGRASKIISETPLQLVNEYISEAEGSIDIRDFKDSIFPVLDFAYFTSEESNTKEAVMRAREFLNTTGFSEAQQQAMDANIIAMVNDLPKIEAARNGISKPWFDYAVSRSLLTNIHTVITGLKKEVARKFLDNGMLRTENLPTSMQKELGLIEKPEPTIKQQGATTHNAATRLVEELRRLNKSTTKLNAETEKAVIKKLVAMYAEVEAADLSDFIDSDDNSISDYFDDGQPIVNKFSGLIRIGTTSLSEAEIKAREKLAAQDLSNLEDESDSVNTLEDYNNMPLGGYNDEGDSRSFRDDGTPITGPVPIGRIKLLIADFLRKLSTKPTVSIYKNQADLKAKNPRLYAKAIAGRPQGDFDTASAVGYSFGDGQVVIFSDRVATEKQLRFVLAHETLGHFGFRGLLTAKELNAALDAVYNDSAKVRAAVDTAMQSRSMSRHEATEEYLADFAGVLDTNVLARFWNSIKNALNKLGIKFEDDMARYLVSQSRRYVRNGATSGSFVDFKAMAKRMMAIEGMDDPDGVGRFALNAEFYDEYSRIAADDAQGHRSFEIGDATAWYQKAKDKGINLKDMWDRLGGELKTMNYAARENQGYRALYNIFRDSSKVASQLRSKYISIRKNTLAPAVEAFGKLLSEGATKAQLDTTSRMLNVTTRIKGPALTDAIINKMGSLVTFINGEATPNQAVFDAISKQGRFTLEDFKKGFKYTEGKERPMNDTQRNKLRAERDAELAKATTDIEKNSINKSYTILIDAKSYTEAVPAEFPAMPSLTEKSYEWIMYNENRDAMDQSAMDLLLANFAAAKGERANVEIVVKAFLGRALSENNKKFLQTIEEKYIALRSENSIVDDKGGVTLNPDSLKKGDKFLEDFNKAVLGLMTDRNINVAAYFKSAEADDITTGIEELKKDSNIIRDNEHKFVMQQAIANLALFEQSKLQAEQLAKQTIAGGYAPFGREGIWEVRINAVDPTSGYVYKVSERYREQLLYMQLDSRADSDSTAARVNGIFAEAVSESSDGLFEVEVLDGAEYVVKKVKLVAVSEAASTTVSSTAETNLNEVIATVSRFGINLTPAARTKLILGLTNQNNRARSRLRRSGTPGEDIDTIKYISKHLESISSTIAKKRIKHRLDRLFDEGDGDSNRLWRGDKVEYERRKKAWATAKDDAAMSEVKKAAIKREFDDMHYTYVYKESPIMGNRYKDRGRRLVSFMDAQKDVDFTDFGSGEVMGKIRGATTFAQLGLSPATAILNYLSLATNVLPALAAYNPKNAFGGGFGWSRASIEMSKALRQTKNMEQSKSSYWDGLLADDKLLLESGFSRLEARFMQKEVAGGTMQAALYNAQMGSARGKLTSGARRTIAEAWMGLFNYSEQAARRSTGLATFRMAFDRAIQEGNDTESAFEIADQLATDMIDNTLGEYAMYNRPALFRGDVRQFIFQYKLFVVNSIEMLLSLPRKQQLLALGIMMMFSGLKGLPFADDLMDLLDTVAQALGLGSGRVWKGSAEATVAEFLNDVMPGMTPIVMRGLLNNITPANVSDRVSLSNVIPGTGFALSGADKGRELLDIAGPVASFLQGAVVTGVDAARWGILEPIGISPDVTSLTSIARNSPITMLRAAGDLSAYTSAGAIVNRKGYVVSNNLTAMTYLTRALGFYPSSATKENDVVRVATRISDYQKDISAVYKGLYVSAVIAGDSVRAREVVDMVNDWNESAKGTGLEINNFEKSANKAVKEAKRPASARYLKSTPKAMRPETERLLQIYGVEEEPI
jgi:hypothetical protein